MHPVWVLCSRHKAPLPTPQTWRAACTDLWCFFFSPSLFPSPVELEQTPVKPLWLESCCQVIFKSSWHFANCSCWRLYNNSVITQKTIQEYYVGHRSDLFTHNNIPWEKKLKKERKINCSTQAGDDNEKFTLNYVYFYGERLSIHHHKLEQKRACDYLDINILHG